MTKFVSHPLEEVFDLPQNSTMAPVQVERQDIVEISDSDEMINEEDRQIAAQLSTVYAYAVEAYENQINLTQEIDPKFAARNAEVAAQFLKIALDSVSDRAKIRHNKLKLKVEGGTPESVTNQLIVADRNELLRIMKGEDK